jgi:cyclophilin family peptidyl-prolyl cis-trans isomerase
VRLDGWQMRAGLAAALAAGALALGACGGDEEEEPATTAATTAEADASEACAPVDAPVPKDLKLGKPSGNEVKPGEKVTATVETNCGEFQIALDTKGSPETASSFVHMVEEGLYEDTPFHRVVEGFVVQGGDPAGDGTGGPGYTTREPPPSDTAYTKGVVAMAKTGVDPPGTAGSQFFVVVGADAGLPPDYAVLGEVTGDDEALENIESVGVPGEDGPPQVPVVIEKITLKRG